MIGLTNDPPEQDLVDIKLFSELIRVERALVQNQSVVEALAWCGENRGTLKKIKVCNRVVFYRIDFGLLV